MAKKKHRSKDRKKGSKKSRGRDIYLYKEYGDVQDNLTDDYDWDEEDERMGIKVPSNIRDDSLPGYGSYYGGGTSYPSGGYVAAGCNHKGDKVVFEKDGKKLYGSNYMGLDEFSGEWDLIIDLASLVRWPTKSSQGFVKATSAKRFDSLKPFITQATQQMPQSEVLSLDWPDMGVAPANLDFWLKLWEMLPSKTVMACQGGHGRTGTCLCALMIASGESYYDAINIARTKHCKKAVEALKQEEYLHGLYTEYLERCIKLAEKEGDDKGVQELLDKLTYATQNPPTFSNTKAVKAGNKTGGQDWSQDTWHESSYAKGGGKKLLSVSAEEKMLGVVIIDKDKYIPACMDPECDDPLCEISEHQGYVKYEEGVM